MGWLQGAALYVQQRIHGSLWDIVSLLGYVIGTVNAGLTYFSMDLPIWFLFAAAAYPIPLTMWILYREIDLARRRRYAPASAELRVVLRYFQDICCFMSIIEDKTEISHSDLSILQRHFSQTMSDLLSSLAKYFTVVTGQPCRACIKIIPDEFIQLPIEEQIVLTMARDRDSQEINYQSDRDRYHQRRDRIIDNSDYTMLYDPTKPDSGYYICNNIPRAYRKGEYKNTSIAYRGGEDASVLPYRSCITWPIRRVTNDPNGRVVFIGFLGIDAPGRGAFNHYWDAPVGMAIAYALFEPIYRFTEIKQQAQLKQVEESAQTA